MLFTIKDFTGCEVFLKPSVALYDVQDFMGKCMPGLAILLDKVNAQGEEAEPYTVLTISFGEFIGIKNAAYIDINNCPFADQLLDFGIAEKMNYDKDNGFCRYPLWKFQESFLKEIGGAEYRLYSDTYDVYVPPIASSTENAADEISAFEEIGKPFYIVEHDNGICSLCLPVSFSEAGLISACQKAFDTYAEQIGDSPIDSYGLRSHGNGYEWEAVFREAFKDDPNLSKIQFISEAGGFFCYANDFSLLSDMGMRFLAICKDCEQFSSLIAPGIQNHGKQYQREYHSLGTVRKFMAMYPEAIFSVMTPDGTITLEPEDCRQLLRDRFGEIKLPGGIFINELFLTYDVTTFKQDPENPNRIQIYTNGFEMEHTIEMTM